ncbi:unnamed protein product [Kuraishia capsulata CBS 1993]|uniref:Transcription initiation factor TFIID subunit 2 n=1 Tax=Kuraishia capsulata CBS 1993 TaxID=1382522 RepID=W6MP99_9ASCO|nr:uncharacterized protein KUCA_T00002904001 [Kuraishia capsulata CBS 1993]CDK26927.1 unnamed protein product [Kuraishia capsulata CBS 1993]
MPSSIGDYPSVQSYATPRKSKHHIGEFDYSSQPLKVALQKVTVDINLATQTIDGETEITVLPLSPGLRVIKLDCRAIQIREVFVNNKRCQYMLNDFLQNDEYQNDLENETLRNNYKFNERYDVASETISIEQHHLYRGKFHPLFSDNNDPDSASTVSIEETENLTIVLPENLKLRLHDPNALSTISPATGKSTHNTPITANSLAGAERVYTPLTLKIVYQVKSPKEGVLFHGGLHTNIPKEKWCCYTSNSDLGCSASSWVPCIDNFQERPAWEVSISVPKTIRDIGETKIIGTKEAELAMRKRNLMENDDDDAENDDAQETEDQAQLDDSAYLDREFVVVCPDSVSMKEFPHQIDMGKKIIGFQFHNPSAAHHIGFAVGAFESMPILKLGEDDIFSAPATADDGSAGEPGTSQMPLNVYYMPGRKAEVLNTCLFLPKALDFYSNEFGSFPFNSYSLVFIDDLPATVCGFAGLTIANTDLLYGPNLIEPMFEATETLAVALSQQYSGINVLPYSLNDVWCTIGISRYMAGQYLRRLYGWNHFKFQTKKRSDLVCDLDIGKRPLANQLYRFPVNEAHDFDFINLKAPLVLFILDRRMTKTDKSFGLSRVIPKVFLQAMSGDLISGNCLSTAHFQHVCEKVAHNRLESFFQNWVHNSGTPVFKVTQRFNKKRMFIEMGIRQVPSRDDISNHDGDFGLRDRSSMASASSKQQHRVSNFLNDASEVLSGEESQQNSHVFTGPMTIRIHEADGTPYEHIVDIKEPFTKFDIQYNTKYKRLKRPSKKDEEGVATAVKDDDLKSVRMLGDILSSQKEMAEWGLQGFTEEEMEARSGEAFEWIRADADFEWLCRIYVNQPDYMYQSQLNQDRDVEAQLDSVRFFSNALKPSSFYFTALLRTLLDSRYYFGVRIEAAFGLAKLSNQENGFKGLKYLLVVFKTLFCYDTKVSAKDALDQIALGLLPLPNDFSNFEDLFVREAIPEALATVRGNEGEIPLAVSRALVNVLKFNDNSANDFADCFYTSTLVSCLSSVILNSKLETDETENSPLKKVLSEALFEIDRLFKLDEWVPSYHNTVRTTVLSAKLNMARKGIINLPFDLCLNYSKSESSRETRLVAIESILTLGGLRNAALLKYIFSVMKFDTSHSFRDAGVGVFIKSLAIAALEGVPYSVDDEEFYEDAEESGHTNLIGGADDVIVVEDAINPLKSRRGVSTHSLVIRAINTLRRDLSIGKGLRHELWTSLHSCFFSVHSKRELFDIIDVLYQAYDKFSVTVDRPMQKKLAVVYDKLVVKDPAQPPTSFFVSLKLQGRLKVQLATTLKRAPVAAEPVRPIIKLKTRDGIPKVKLELKHTTDSPSGQVPPATKTTPKVPSVKLKAPTVKSVSEVRPKFEVKFKYSSGVISSSNAATPKTKRTVDFEILRSTPDTPLRYVKYMLNQHKVVLSSDEFRSDTTMKVPVTLKIHPAILRAEEYRVRSMASLEETPSVKRRSSDQAGKPPMKKQKPEESENEPSVPKIRLKLKF